MWRIFYLYAVRFHALCVQQCGYLLAYVRNTSSFRKGTTHIHKVESEYLLPPHTHTPVYILTAIWPTLLMYALLLLGWLLLLLLVWSAYKIRKARNILYRKRFRVQVQGYKRTHIRTNRNKSNMCVYVCVEHGAMIPIFGVAECWPRKHIVKANSPPHMCVVWATSDIFTYIVPMRVNNSVAHMGGVYSTIPRYIVNKVRRYRPFYVSVCLWLCASFVYPHWVLFIYKRSRARA